MADKELPESSLIVARTDLQALSSAWANLKRPSDMFDLAEKAGLKLDEAKLRLIACDCAELVLPLFEKIHPKDKWPRRAIDMARRSTKSEVTKQALDTARDGARDAAARDISAVSRSAGADVLWDAELDASRFAASAAASAAWDDAWACSAAERSKWDIALDEAWADTVAARSSLDSNWETRAAVKAAIKAAGAGAWAIAYSSVKFETAAWAAADAAKTAAWASTMLWQADRIRFYFANPFRSRS
jgi:hypothetical protein